jgi:hypothetical protein
MRPRRRRRPRKPRPPCSASHQGAFRELPANPSSSSSRHDAPRETSRCVATRERWPTGWSQGDRRCLPAPSVSNRSDCRTGWSSGCPGPPGPRRRLLRTGPTVGQVRARVPRTARPSPAPASNRSDCRTGSSPGAPDRPVLAGALIKPVQLSDRFEPGRPGPPGPRWRPHRTGPTVGQVRAPGAPDRRPSHQPVRQVRAAGVPAALEHQTPSRRTCPTVGQVWVACGPCAWRPA